MGERIDCKNDVQPKKANSADGFYYPGHRYFSGWHAFLSSCFYLRYSIRWYCIQCTTWLVRYTMHKIHKSFCLDLLGDLCNCKARDCVQNALKQTTQWWLLADQLGMIWATDMMGTEPQSAISTIQFVQHSSILQLQIRNLSNGSGCGSDPWNHTHLQLNTLQDQQLLSSKINAQKRLKSLPF